MLKCNRFLLFLSTKKREQKMSSGFGNTHGTLGPVGASEPTIRLKHTGGAIVNEKPFLAALSVVCNGAKIIGGNGKPIPPATVVVCRRKFGPDNPLRQSRIGIPIQAIDPGKEHDLYVLPRSTTFAPTISKEQCRGVGECTSFDGQCVGCCNFPSTKKIKNRG